MREIPHWKPYFGPMHLTRTRSTLSAPSTTTKEVSWMRNLVIATGGFLVGTGLVIALLLALPQTTNVTVKQAAPQTPAMPHINGGMAAMRSGDLASASLTTRKLMIQHVQRGCHVWSDGKTTAAMMRLHLRVGQKLSILDQDVDAHQMLQFAGPMHLRMGKPMMTNHGMTLAFTKKGVYRLGTKTVEMPGMTMDVKTIGPDNNLRLLVTVA